MKPYKMALPESMEERQAMSRRVRNHAFVLGWESLIIKDNSFSDHRFLYFDSNGTIRYSKLSIDFIYCDYEEIAPEAFLALPIPGADFLADFEAGRYVVGKFWDDGDREEHKAISILEFVITTQPRAAKVTKIYCTKAIRCQNFEYMKTFDEPGQAEKYIRECLGI